MEVGLHRLQRPAPAGPDRHRAAFREVRLRLAGAVGIAFLLAAGPHPAFMLTASILDVDAVRDRVVGQQVRLSDGKRTLRAMRLVMDRRSGRGRLEGGVAGEGPEGSLFGRILEVHFTRDLRLTGIALRGGGELHSGERTVRAERIELDPRTGIAVATGGAVLRMERGELRAPRIAYRSLAGTASVAGPCTVRTPEGTLVASGAEVDLRAQDVRLLGPVRFTFPDLVGSADRARAALREGRAVLEGGVRARWRASLLEAGRVVVWYRANRIVIEDAGRVRIEGTDAGR